MRKMHTFGLRAALRVGSGATLILVAGLAQAQQGTPPAGGQGGEGGHRGPPPEAIAACKAISSGQACSFTTPRGTMQGTCWAPEGKPLACKPKDAPAFPGGAASGPK